MIDLVERAKSSTFLKIENIMRALFVTLYFFCFTATAGDSSSSHVKFAKPVLSPEKVVELTENYLKKEKQIKLNNYDLARLEFTHYTSPDRPRMIDSSGWFIGYNCKKHNYIVKY